jgi:hypothetical protein
MGAYKKLNKQDAYITTYTAHKPWVVARSSFDSYGITRPLAGEGYVSESLQQLYYKAKNSDGNVVSHSFDTYNQTTLFYSSSRNLTLGSQVISIPRQMYGTAIKPSTFKLTITAANLQDEAAAIEGSFQEGYVSSTPTVFYQNAKGEQAAVEPPIFPPLPYITYVFVDDGEGNLYLEGSPNTKVGDIIYSHGMAIVTSTTYRTIVSIGVRGSSNKAGAEVRFESTQPIFTHNYHCKIRESEYNFTYNPTATSSSLKTVYDNSGDIYSTSSAVNNGVISNKLTGSAFQPYITTVGLYNDANELIAVGKMTRPIPKSANTEMTIIVKIDI